MPNVVLDSLHTAVYVMPFTNKGGIPSNAGERVAQAISIALDDDNLGVKGGSKESEILRLNPLSFTQWYHSARNREEADVLVNGTYTANIDGYSNVWQEHSAESGYVANPIPFTYFRFEDVTIGAIMGDVFIYKNGETMPVMTLPLDVTVKDSSMVFCRAKAPVSDKEMIRKLEDAFIDQATHLFNPYLSVHTYTFHKLKSSNKEINRAFDALNKTLEKEIAGRDIFRIGELYLDALEIEDNPDIHENLGFCYEIIGNLPQALRHYEIARAYESIERVTNQLQVREVLESFGYEFKDEEFKR